MNSSGKSDSMRDIKKRDREESADIVIIGSGFAGLAAAIEAHDAGASVLVLEKMNAPGGNSIISDGGIAAAGTEMQKKLGIIDSPELMYRDMLKAGLGINHPELVRVVTENSNEVFQWSKDYLGVKYLDRLDIFGGHSVPRCFTPVGVSGSAIIKRQLAKLGEMGIKVRAKTLFKTFLNDISGRICGVIAQEDYTTKNPEAGNDKFIMAKKAVVLASGGFGGDLTFRVAQDPRLDEKIDTTNKPYTTAEALKEALRIGAMPIHLSHIQLGPWASPDEKGYGVATRFSDYVLFQYGIIVNPKTSKRFVNELADRKTISDAILNTGHPCIGITDAQAVEQSNQDIKRCLVKGVVRAFDTLPELASFYGLSTDDLKLTIQTFNKHVAGKRDVELRKPILPDAKIIAVPPYYGIRLWPKIHHTMGGVQINVRGQALNLNQNPIRGLYAAGEVVGGIHGACRLGSCAITDCLVFGRVCGRNAVTENDRQMTPIDAG